MSHSPFVREPAHSFSADPKLPQQNYFRGIAHTTLESCEPVKGDGETYLDVLAAHNRGVEALAHSMGWTFATHHTNRPPEMALLALFLVLSAGCQAG